MLNEKQALKIAQQQMPTGKIQKVIVYKNLFIFQIFRSDIFEEDMDPFYSIDRFSGEFKEFSIFTDGPMDIILSKFEQKYIS